MFKNIKKKLSNLREWTRYSSLNNIIVNSFVCRTISYYAILYYTWGKGSYHACGKSLLQSKTKQFYYPRSEDSL